MLPKLTSFLCFMPITQKFNLGRFTTNLAQIVIRFETFALALWWTRFLQIFSSFWFAFFETFDRQVLYISKIGVPYWITLYWVHFASQSVNYSRILVFWDQSQQRLRFRDSILILYVFIKHIRCLIIFEEKAEIHDQYPLSRAWTGIGIVCRNIGPITYVWSKVDVYFVPSESGVFLAAFVLNFL